MRNRYSIRHSEYDWPGPWVVRDRQMGVRVYQRTFEQAWRLVERWIEEDAE